MGKWKNVSNKSTDWTQFVSGIVVNACPNHPSTCRARESVCGRNKKGFSRVPYIYIYRVGSNIESLRSFNSENGPRIFYTNKKKNHRHKNVGGESLLTHDRKQSPLPFALPYRQRITDITRFIRPYRTIFFLL